MSETISPSSTSWDGFTGVLDDLEALVGLYGEPSVFAKHKEIDVIDEHCRKFLASVTLALIGTANREGRCDVSPKGGPAGFVTVLDDHHIAIGDLQGNNRVDSWRNVVDTGLAGLLCLVPGHDETLRINGEARLVRDPDVLARTAIQKRTPSLALVVRADEVFLHCAKAFRRGAVWKPDRWVDRSLVPSIACAIKDHIGRHGVTIRRTTEELEAALEDDYRTNLW